MFDDEDNYMPRIDFSYNAESKTERDYINMSVETETYTAIVEKFRFFLQAIGYTYISNVAVYGEDGEELFSTSY